MHGKVGWLKGYGLMSYGFIFKGLQATKVTKKLGR